MSLLGGKITTRVLGQKRRAWDRVGGGGNIFVCTRRCAAVLCSEVVGGRSVQAFPPVG